MEPYPILRIPADAPQELEVLGTKDKFWFRSEGSRWLFKIPQTGTGQHWAEKIAAAVADLLGIRNARVELAEFGDQRGSASLSFVEDGAELYHGNQLLAATLFEYERDLRFGQSRHKLENILLAIRGSFPNPASIDRAEKELASYLVLDALIGNTDRHHENWGILVKPHEPESLCLAPSYDHASSLGRELQDTGSAKSREERLRNKQVGLYAQRAHGAIFWSEEGRRAPSPLDLVRLAYTHQPALFGPALDRLDLVQSSALRATIESIPHGWMSELARTFALELMLHNLDQLRKITR